MNIDLYVQDIAGWLHFVTDIHQTPRNCCLLYTSDAADE